MKIKNNTAWNIQHECVSIANRCENHISQSARTKQRNPVVLSRFLKVTLLYIVRVVGTALAVIAVLQLAPINLFVGIIVCLALCALFGWVAMKIEKAQT